MNIFYLHKNPYIAAQMMTNKHVVKMIVESAQMLSTAHNVCDSRTDLYKSTHVNHPSSVWVRKSPENYRWLYNHFIALCIEYNKRYLKTHATEILLREKLLECPKNIGTESFSEPPLIMPDKYKTDTSLKSYRAYYVHEKIKNSGDLRNYFAVLIESLTGGNKSETSKN